MTCLLNTYGQIQNLSSLIDFLKEPSSSNSTDTGNSEENDEWDWKDQNEIATESNKRPLENWLDSFLISVSPCGNLIVLASQTHMAICLGKWSMNNQAVFSASHRVDFKRTAAEENEKITAICVVPIASQRKSGEGLLDWTCILVGSNTGKLRMYTENGTLLNTQIFHTGAILKIKCRTHEPAKYVGWIQQPEEIEILYANNVLVCIDGCNMYHYFRMARKYAASGLDGHSEINELISSLSLDFKIWHLNNQDCLADFVSAGLTSENRFDQMFAASMIGGPGEKFESIPPISNRYLTCGGPPYLSFFYTIEGLSIPVLTEVKQAAGKVTSALMNAAKGWIGFGRSAETAKEAKPKIEPPTLLPSRFALNDLRRKGETVIIAPANNLAAVTDSFARVILIDVLKGIAVRIFKGYRDAQIGWICVDDETEDKNNKRYALYLIIYAPRRGLLEIWGCQQGIRVAAFNVGKTSRLFFPGYYMLSLNGSLANDHLKTNHKIQCFLVSDEGVIRNVQIPFHLILSDKSNQRVRDTILLKKLKSFLRSESEETDQLWQSVNVMLKEFKTASIKQQALERIVTTRYLSPLKIYETLNEELKAVQGQGQNQSTDSMKLGSFCKFNCRLIYSYMFVCEFKAMPVDMNEEEGLNQLLQVDEASLSNYFDLRQRNEKSIDPESESSSFDLTKYLQCFESTNLGATPTTDTSVFSLNKNISLKSKKALGNFYFSKLLSLDLNYNNLEIQGLIEPIPLNKIDLLNLLVVAWIGNYYKNIGCMYKLVLELTGFTSYIAGLSTGSSNKNSTREESDPTNIDLTEPGLSQTNEDGEVFETLFINEYIGRFRTICENTSITYMTSSLLAIWIFRSVLIQSNQQQNQIDMLTGLSERTFMLIKFHSLLLTGTKRIETASINLKSTFSKGKGVLSEIVAKHIVLNEFPPQILTFITPLLPATDDQAELNIDNNPGLLLKDESFREFYEFLQETRNYLPQSLEPDILLSNSAWEAVIAANSNLELDIHYFEMSLRYIGEIGNAILKQGVLSMIWHQYLVKRVSTLTNLIDKVGKTPKDRQLRKEVGLNEHNILKFIECVLTVLDLIMDANCNTNEVPIFMHDKFWNDHSEFDNVATASFLSLNSLYYDETTSKQDTNYALPITVTPKQLVELAAEQKHVNYSLCLFHSQLIRILYLIVRYNMKLVRPLAFFDTKGRHTLFSELHTHPVISNDVDIKIMNARKQFFTKTMNSIMETVELPVTTRSKLPKEIDECFSTIFNLSKDMGVDLEFIKGYYCSMLYALDYHNEAEKVLRTIKDIEVVACQLLVVVGCKINAILSAHFDANLVSILSTNLTSWLKSLGSSEYRIYTLPSKQPMLELIGNVIMKLSDSVAEHGIAVELFDFIENPEFQF